MERFCVCSSYIYIFKAIFQNIKVLNFEIFKNLKVERSLVHMCLTLFDSCAVVLLLSCSMQEFDIFMDAYWPSPGCRLANAL
jgi:hypothetical protein